MNYFFTKQQTSPILGGFRTNKTTFLKVVVLLLVLFGSLTTKAQFADPAVTGAVFVPDEVATGVVSELSITFSNTGFTAIPVGAIELTISAPEQYYSTDGSTEPIGTGGAMFNWVYLGGANSDIWRGTNKVMIAGQSGGLITLSYIGIAESSTYEVTNINVQPVANFNMFNNSAANDNLQPGLKIVSGCPNSLDTDNDGLTDCEEENGIDDTSTTAVPSGTSDPLDPCDPDPSAVATGDCDGDGNPNGTDPHVMEPVAFDDNISAVPGVLVSINILTNDDFLPGLNTFISNVGTGTAQGDVAFNPMTGMLEYTPLVTEIGNYTLNYEVCNTSELPNICAEATVFIQSALVAIDCEIACPSDFEFNLNQGECDAIADYAFPQNGDCSGEAFSLTQSTDLNDFGAAMQSCATGDNHYYRMFDLAAMGRTTDLNVTSVRFGLFETVNNPTVKINIYTTTTTIGSDMVLVGSNTMNLLSNMSPRLFEFPVTATVDVATKMVVEIITPGSIFGGNILATNTGGEAAPGFYSAVACGDALASMTNSVIMEVVGIADDLKVVKTSAGDLALGDAFPIGTTNLEYTIYNVDGTSKVCNFNVIVNPFADTIGAMACNNLVQVSLDENCEAYIGADQILEGQSYSCYADYTVHIEDQNGSDIGNYINGEYAGQTLNVTIEGPNGNSCWGKIFIEDKIGAELECKDVYTSCSGSTDPGANIPTTVSFVSSDSKIISESIANQINIAIPVFGMEGAKINDIDIKMAIDHSNIPDLKVALLSPQGTYVTLFTSPTSGVVGCDHDNLKVTINDQADLANVMMTNMCLADGIALEGAFKSEQSLASFNNEDPNGIWTLIISDLNATEGGVFKNVELKIGQSGAKITLPIPEDATYVKLTDNRFIVTGLDPCGKTQLDFEDEIIEQTCSSSYSEIIKRRWATVDANGNEGTTCVQTIYIYRTDATDIIWPSNYDDIDKDHLSCNQWKDEVPGPNVTGLPKPPTGAFCDNVQIFAPIDTRIDICESSYKILRYWKVLEWCSGDIYEYTQVIKVLDDQIKIVCPTEEIEASEGTYSCSGFATLPAPTVVNECSGWYYKVKWFENENDPIATSTGVTYNQATGLYTIVGLREGVNTVEYTAIDSCGNQDVCTVEVTVEDNINPTAVCDQFTKVSIAADGKSIVHAETFDDGSTDNCGIVKWDARKMVNKCSEFDKGWHEDLIFCCEEIGDSLLVEFRVTDAAGLENSCMVTVYVEDKLPPYITYCPEDITLECIADWEDLSVTGRPEYIDNCKVVLVDKEDSVNLNSCGVGTITRTWTVKDEKGGPLGTGLKATCTQVITLVDNDPFEEKDIVWPSKYINTGCQLDLDPDNLPNGKNYPTFKKEDACNLVAATYKDQVFTIVDSACVKILRTWTVIDWCTYNDKDVNDQNSTGIWQRTQMLELTNKIAPVFESCEDFEVCAYTECITDPNVTLKQSAEDECTPSEDLIWTYQLDLGRDGFIDQFGNSNKLTENIAYGSHSIKWSVEDLCGNITSCTQNFEVVDCKKPTPYCIGEVVTTVMNSNGSIEIWASDFDLGSFDNCTAKENLIFSFTGSTNQNARKKVITCADIPNGEEAMIPVKIWVIDEAGNRDYCEVILRVQDNESDICDPQTETTVSGYIMTEDEEMIENVMVTSNTAVSEHQQQMMTTSNGEYSFGLAMDFNYSIRSERSDDPMNGVSTLDLLLIQRHILKLKELDSPYKLIAADVDNNEKINGKDLIELRKLILGKISSFPDTQKEWRFVNQAVDFDDPTHPFPFVEKINIAQLNEVMTEQNFVGVKIGDVNGNAKVNVHSSQIEPRNGVSMYTDAVDFEAGDQLSIPIRLSDLTVASGMQFTIAFDATTMEYNSYEAGAIVVNNKNFGLNMIDRSMITFSWNDKNGVSFLADEVLFTINFKAIQSGSLNENFDLNSDFTVAELYDGALNTSKVNFNVRSTAIAAANQNELFQNTPNPFREVTNISFNLAEAGDATIRIFDVTGKLVMSKTDYYNAGLNTVEFDFTGRNISGVFHYQLSKDSFISSKKMIIIE